MAGTPEETRVLGYRPAIDGLRALAIVLVLAAHARLPGLAGGFVGVDVFFVISGYLISALLLGELHRDGRLQLASFFARRLRRLLPALLVMLLLSSLAALLLLSPSQQDGAPGDALAALSWTSNLLFAFAQRDYFAAQEGGNLFLHTWSLGVEEQFYLLWPLLLWAAWRLGRGRAVDRLLWAVLALSALGCAWLTELEPRWAFYLMPSRAWQFALGALAWRLAPLLQRQAATVTALGLGLIVLAALGYDERTPYPGVAAWLPTVGAALCLLVCDGPADRGSPLGLLASIPMRWIGQRSYAWYLWHWPLLVIGMACWPQGGWPWRALLCMAALPLAMLTYRYVEPRWRRYGALPRPGRSLLLGGAAMAGLMLLACGWDRLLLQWSQSPAQRHYLAARNDLPSLYADRCDEWFHGDRLTPCRFGPADAPHTAVLLGDSVVAQWFPAVQAIFTRPDWKLVVLTKSACPMIDAPIFYERIGRDYVECQRWRQAALAALAQWRPQVVITGSAATYAYRPEQWRDGEASVLRALNGAAAQVYLLRGTPRLPVDGPGCLAGQSLLAGWLKHAARCGGSAEREQDAAVWAWQRQAAQQFARVRTVDTAPLVCPGGRCQAERDGVVVFRDSQHLTARFVLSLRQPLAHRLGQPTGPSPGP